MTDITSYLRKNSNKGQLRTGNVLVQSMRNNIQQLNRSMSSIEKMIAQSRKIIFQSRQSSMNKTINIENKPESPYKSVVIGVSPRVEPPTIKKKAHPPTPSNIESNPASRIKGVANSRSFAYTSKFNKTALEHQNNLIKYQPQTVKKQIQLRRSAVKEERLSQSRKDSESKMDVNESTPPKKQKKDIRLQNTPVTAPYAKQINNNNEIYKFSPQRTSQQRAPPPSQPKQVNKIKLKPTPRNATKANRKPYIKLQTNKEPDMIKIEDDGYQSDPPQSQSYVEQQSQDKSVRFKTEYVNEDSPSLINRYSFGSPTPNARSQQKKTSTRGKVKLRLFDNESSKKEPSYRDQKLSGVQLAIDTPRQNRQQLVKQLQRLQTESSTEEERKAKFILKIRKYGFVQKYLSETEVWSIYDYLVGSHIPELKWPIYIVDEVYKKMKSKK